MSSEEVYKRIELKRETSDRKFTAMCNVLEKHGNFLSSEVCPNGVKIIHCRFDNGLDCLAFLVATDLATMRKVVV